MSDELFQIPESLSPRLKWIEHNQPRIKEKDEALALHRNWPKDKFCAWFPENDGYYEDRDDDDEDGMMEEPEPTGGPDKIHLCGFGDTEDDALRDLCCKTGTKHWTQE